jgi:4,5-DOPA dioxygenase extradiol
MPAAFLGHGSPMNALERNRYSEAWRGFAQSIPAPKAVLTISAHWYTDGTAVTAMDAPRTIHDFGGFPRELFAVEYAAPGDPRLASRVRDMLAPIDVQLDRSWGLDHGTWSLLVHMFPGADVPALQLSIDATKPAAFHYELGRRLAPLRDEGVLILGSGNVVHNLRTARWGAGAQPYDWAVRFNDSVRDRLQRNELAALIDYERFGEPARLSVPTPEHYLPLLYVAGLHGEDDSLSLLVDGLELGSISMLSFATDRRSTAS